MEKEAARLKPEIRDSEKGKITAEKRAVARLEFYRHLFVYVGVNAFLITINLFSNPFSWWFPFPLLAWGVFVFLHWLKLK